MKRSTKLIILASVFFTTVTNLFAQKSTVDSIQLAGRFTENEVKPTQILIGFNRIDWFPNPNAEYVKTTVDSNGRFSFKLPDLGKPYRINFFAKDNKGETVWNYLFYVEPGDDININILKNGKSTSKEIGDSTIFSGRGSEKYNLALRLQQDWKRYWKELGLIESNKVVKDSGDMELKLSRLIVLTRKFRERKRALIDNANISTEIKTILNYEPGQYDYNSDWDFRLTLLWQNNSPFRQMVADNYFLYNKEFVETPGHLAAYCNSYITGLVRRNVFELMILENSTRVGLKLLYERIKSNYSGLVLERMLGTTLISKIIDAKYQSYKPSLKDSLMKDALGIVTLPYIREALLQKVNLYTYIKPGTKAFEAEFVSIDGEKFDSKSLNGKVVLYEVWFNGCSGCGAFHSAFEKNVYPKFKDNKRFAVLSINMDKTKDRWIKGMESNHYTSGGYVNVWTGNGMDHPFLKYYNIEGAPWLMLVDAKGNVYYLPSGTSVEELTSKIQAALSEKSDTHAKNNLDL